MKGRTLFSLALTLAVTLAVAAPFTTALAALPTDMSWVKYASNPVLAVNSCRPGEVFRPAVVVESAGNYKMYFSHRSDGAQIYLAETSDGGETWTCGNSSNPVLTLGGSGDWDETRVMTASVVKDGVSDYKMWYSARNAAGVYAIGYATSSDGVVWNKHGSNPVFTKGGLGAWDSQIIREPSVVNVGGVYHMFYSGTDNWPRFKIGHATSPDGITWTRDAANPVLAGTLDNWDQNEAYAPSVVYDSGVFEMFYSGNTGNGWLTGHASSPDGTNWTKDDNAILSPDTVGPEAGYDSTDYVAAVLDGSDWKLFYSAGGAYNIHLATLEDEAQLTFNQLAGKLAVGDTLDVYIDLTAVTDLYGYQFQVNYDAAKLNANGAFVNSFFDTAGPTEAIPPGWNAVCAAGTCKFAVTRLNPAPAVSGSGPLAKITFTGVAPGTVYLTFSSDILSDINGGAITHTKTTAWLTVYNTATISGTVKLQGRATPISTGTVTLTDQYGYFAPTVVNYDDTTGAFSADVPVLGGSTEYDLVAAHFVYLSSKKGDSIAGDGIVVTPGGAFSAGITTLRGGDANNSGEITIGDLSCIGGAFGGAPTNCGGAGSSDINEDLTVNILDLVLAGGNYGKTAPQPW